MKKYIVLLVLLIVVAGANSATIPLEPAPVASRTVLPTDPLRQFASLSMKQVQQLAGRKLKWKEKIAIKLLQWKIKKGFRVSKEEPKSDPGKTAMIFGILGIALLFVPVIGGLAALVSAILALVLGYSARRKNPDDRKAKTAILLGWISIGLFVLALLIVVAILASWGVGGWG